MDISSTPPCRLLGTFPGQMEWGQVRLDTVTSVAGRLEGKHGAVEKFRDAYKERANKLSALTESSAELNARRQSLLKAQGKRFLKLTTDSTGRLREISQAVLDTRKVILELKMQGNECVGVASWRIERSNLDCRLPKQRAVGNYFAHGHVTGVTYPTSK